MFGTFQEKLLKGYYLDVSKTAMHLNIPYKVCVSSSVYEKFVAWNRMDSIRNGVELNEGDRENRLLAALKASLSICIHKELKTVFFAYVPKDGRGDGYRNGKVQVSFEEDAKSNLTTIILK